MTNSHLAGALAAATVLAAVSTARAGDEWGYYYDSGGSVIKQTSVQPSGPDAWPDDKCYGCVLAKGDFDAGLTGHGLIVRRDKTEEQGEFRRGQLWSGKRSSADGSWTSFARDDAGGFSGPATFHHHDGSSDTVTFASNRRQGPDIQLLPGGDRLECMFAASQVQGKCRLTPIGGQPRLVEFRPPSVDMARSQQIGDLYPPLSRRLGEQGWVGTSLLVDATGAVADLMIWWPSGFKRLDEASATAVMTRYHFLPATIDGNPVAAFMTLDLNWQMD